MSSVGNVGIAKRVFYGALTAVTGLMLFGSIAAAQGAGNQGGDVQIAQGITARGNGDASAPADSAIVQFIVRHDESKAVAGVEPTNADMANAGGPSTGEVNANDLEPLVDAAKANGISDERIDTLIVPSTAFSTPFGPGVGVLVLQLDKADLKHRVKIADAVTRAANGNALTFDQIGVAYIVNDCATLDRAAIADAAKVAHDQADMMAEVMGLTLGDLIAVDKQPSYQGYGGASGSVCGSIPTMESAKETYLSSFDSNGKAEQEIYEYLTVTYAIG